MALFNFRRKEEAAPATGGLEAFLKGYSIEVMPRTAEKVESFRDILPKGTRVYIANIESPIEEMTATAKRIVDEGFDVMPHFPARIIKDKATPNVTDKKFPGNPTRSYRTKGALRVLGEVTGWSPTEAGRLAEMRAFVARTRAEGIEPIE